MKLNEVTIVESRQSLVEAQMYESRKILIESMSGLNVQQRKIVQGIYNEFEPLIREIKLTEATLTPDQIEKMFGDVEQTATSQGGNRTGLGKAKDVPAKVSEILGKMGTWVQNTTPVKGFDEKFEKLKKDIRAKAGDDSKFIKSIDAMSKFAKENPGKTAAIIGVLTAVASVVGGPLGGAIAGQVLRGATELLKGEKLSTAIGKGLKTAAFGFLTGAALEAVGGALAGLRADVIMKDAFAEVSFGATRTMTDGFNTFTRTLEGINIKVLPEDAEKINEIMKIISGGDDRGKVAAWYRLQQIAAEIRSGAYSDVMREAGVKALNNDEFYNAIKTATKGITAAAQGMVAAAGVKGDAKGAKKESTEFYKTKLSEGQVYLLFNKLENIQLLAEAEAEQDAKPAPEGEPEQKEKKPGFFSRMGKNLTTKITADKLNKAWKKAGSPTDSNELANFLRQQGVSDEVLTPVYKQMKLKVPAAPKQTDPNAKQTSATGQSGGTTGQTGATGQSGGTAGGKTSPTGQTDGAAVKKAAQGFSYNDVKSHIAKLTAKDKRRLLTYLGKSKPSSTTAKAPTKKPATQPAGIKQGGYQTTGPTA